MMLFLTASKPQMTRSTTPASKLECAIAGSSM